MGIVKPSVAAIETAIEVMGSLFRRTLIAFVTSFAVLLVVLSGALVAGYNYSLSTWSARRVAMVEEGARRILSRDSAAGEEGAQELIPQDVPVFVYDRDGRVIASNRGVGRRREHDEERIPVRENGALRGYYSVGSTAFRNDAANRALTESLLRAAAAGAVAAFGAALVTAWGFARSLTSPAARVAEGIDSIAYGRPAAAIPEQGTEEIARIARAANTLASRLSNERELRAQWAQDVTHDLRTPIASIRARLEAILDGVYTPDAGTIQATLGELGRVERLIADLEELMRLEQPDLALNGSTFSSDDFVETLRQRFHHEIERKQLVWRVHLGVQALCADEALIYRAVSNVVSNAVRHAPERGVINLRIDPARGKHGTHETHETHETREAAGPRTENGGVRITVTNEGPPIPPEELERLFERLYRGEYARNTPGSGLGLTIARRIVLLHNGSIRISSDHDRGTVVSITLPSELT